VAGLIERVRDTDPDLFADVVTASRDQNTIVLETGGRQILFRIGATVKDIQGVSLVMDEIERRHLAPAVLDARWEGRVVLRPGRGSRG
jgi:hypothetical protein